MNVKEGPVFYSTNTTANITLRNTQITSESGILLKAGTDMWGQSGANGAIITLTIENEKITGSVILDNISAANLILKNNSIYSGAINVENTAKKVSLSIDSTSVWNVIETSYITTLTNSDPALANIASNGFIVYYDAASSDNDWLAGKTFNLNGGGMLTPLIK